MARRLATIFVLYAASAAAADTESFRYYAIGASFLNDHRPRESDYFVPWFGLDITTGFHIRGGSTTTTIVNNPTEGSWAFGNYETALQDLEWDALVVQVFPANGTGVADDVANLQYFASLMDSPETPIYIYETWPWRFQVDEWELPLTDEFTQWRRGYYHRVADELAPTIENPVYIIPTGEVVSTLAKLEQAGSVPGLNTLGDIYRDALHTTSYTGSLLSAVTVGTITGRSPVGVAPPTGFAESIDADLLESWDTVLAAVWQAAALEPRSPIQPLTPGDYNSDGLVGAGDQLAYRYQYGGQRAPGLNADGNGDGVVNAADFVVWRESALETEEIMTSSPSDGFDESDLANARLDEGMVRDLYGAAGQPADVNGDGVVDATDYVLWREAGADESESPSPSDGATDGLDHALLSSLYGAVGQPADVNGDGVVNAIDYALWRENNGELLSLAASIEVGDFDGDGLVGASDRRWIYELYGAEVPAGLYADANGDGVVGALDYIRWRENIGASTSTASASATAVPEPGAVVGLVVALALSVTTTRGDRLWA